MKIRIRILLAVTFALSSNSLLALPPATTPELTVALSGDSYIPLAFHELCEPSSLDQYINPSDTIVRAHFCSISLSKLNLPTGISPIGNLHARDLNHDGLLDVLFYMSLSSTNKFLPSNDTKVLAEVCNTASGVVVPLVNSSCKPPAQGGFCPDSVSKIIDGGKISLEVSKFFPNNIICSDKNITQTSIIGQIYNTPVNIKLRNALQCVQGLTVGSDDENNMPTLPKSIIASIFNGGIANWDKIQAKKVDGTFVSLSVAYANRIAQGLCPSVTLPSDTRIRVCKTPNGVASSSQFRIKLLNSLCSNEAQDILVDNTPQSTATSNFTNITPNIPTLPAVIETTDASMSNCIQSSDWTIGISRVDGTSLSTIGKIKIDGYAPTVKNVFEHKYFDWVEEQWIWLNTANTTQDQRDKIDFQQVFLNYMSSRYSLISATPISVFGTSGNFRVNTLPGNMPSLPFDPANTVATSSHSIGGRSDSCRTPIIKVNTSF
jgi:hypothetical protein